MQDFALRPTPSPIPTLLLAALAAAGLAACGGGGDGGSSSAPAPSSPEQQAQDVGKAKALFQLVRDTESALNPVSKDATNTTPGVASGVNAFGASMQTDAVSLATAVTDSIHLDQMAFALWQDYKIDRTNTSGTSNDSATFSGCTVFQGAFPGTSLGSLPAQPGGAATPIVGTGSSIPATSAANATWVSCAKNSGPLLTTGARRYRQVKLYNMSAGYPGTVPYTAVTRAQFRNTATGLDNQVNLTTAVFSGSVGFPGGINAAGGFVLKGDLPPLTDAAGTLLADHYGADLSGTVATLASGSRRATLTSGSFTEWALPAATGGSPTLKVTVDLDNTAAGTTTVTGPTDRTNAQQVAEAAASLYATVSGATGTMTGSVIANTFKTDTGGSLYPQSVKFAGDLSVLPSGGALTKVLSGTLDYVNAGTRLAPLRTVVFNGTLTLPSQPAATLKATVNEVATATAGQPNQHFKIDYARATASLTAEGDVTPSVASATLSDASGVKVQIASTAPTWPITVNGRDAGYVRKSDLMIVYVTGELQSLPTSAP